jgi:hypothetical protein
MPASEGRSHHSDDAYWQSQIWQARFRGDWLGLREECEAALELYQDDLVFQAIVTRTRAVALSELACRTSGIEERRVPLLKEAFRDANKAAATLEKTDLAITMCETYRAIGLGIALLCLGSDRSSEEASLVRQGIEILDHSLKLDPSDVKAKQFRELLTATIKR